MRPTVGLKRVLTRKVVNESVGFLFYAAGEVASWCRQGSGDATGGGRGQGAELIQIGRMGHPDDVPTQNEGYFIREYWGDISFAWRCGFKGWHWDTVISTEFEQRWTEHNDRTGEPYKSRRNAVMIEGRSVVVIRNRATCSSVLIRH